MSLNAVRAAAAQAADYVHEYAKAHPYQSALTIISAGLTPVLGAGWMTAALLKAVGFGPLGPVAGSLAAWYQASYLGAYIPAGSVFAWCQRLAMGA